MSQPSNINGASNQSIQPLQNVTISKSLLASNDLTYVLFHSKNSNSNDETLKFLIDTGASVSLIKSTSITTWRNHNNAPVILNGLSPSAPIATRGETEIGIHSKKIVANFQILDTPTNILCDGLLGGDFLRSQGAKIDYTTTTILLNSIPFQLPLLHNTLQQSIDMIRINPRTETVVPIKLINPFNVREGIVSSQQLNHDDTLLIPNAIVRVDDQNNAIITIVNTSTKVETIPIPELYIESLLIGSHVYNLAPNQSSNETSKRLDVLNQNLRLEHLNKEEHSALSQICTECNAIFHCLPIY